jgi:hypothetical protein
MPIFIPTGLMMDGFTKAALSDFVFKIEAFLAIRTSKKYRSHCSLLY